MMSKINVTKRDGSIEPLDLDKFHKVCFWACDGLTGVSPSEVEIRSNIQFYDRIKTSDIQEVLIKAAADLISEQTSNYQYVAGRLINYQLRKEVYGGPDIPKFSDHVYNIVDLGFYDDEILELYSPDEWSVLDTLINHERDSLLTYAAMEQFRGKYLVKDRVTGRFFETPQMAFLLIAATLFGSYPKNTRMRYVKDFYDAISTFDISLPTPIMSGVRTPQRQFSSCVLIETDDSLDSISATSTAIVKYVSQRAGIGIGGGSIRAVNSPVRGGIASHTGVIPFFKLFQASVASCSQGGVRNGAATLYYPIWHLEIEDLLVLKNNKGTEESRIRHLDYGVQFNKLMYERFLQDGHITLFSPSDVPGLYGAFFADQEKFRELYTAAEKDPKIRKKQVKARDLFSTFMQERKDTGRIYLMNVDHCNDHSSFKDPIRMSNLCLEISLPTEPMDSEDEEIALCTLSAINWGKIKEPEDFEKPCRMAVRALDALLSYQNYPVAAASKAVDRRALGIGIVNLAYWLAKNDMTYENITTNQLQEFHRYVEAWSYYLIRASVDLAKERGPCNLSHRTKYADGILPIDTYKREVDALVAPTYHMDWDSLRADLKEYGIRNSTLMALMPAETSAMIGNSTNGIEPVRALVSVKQSKHGVLKQVVPEIRRLKNKYDLLWNQKSPTGYLMICAVLQKFVDQAISVNTSYNPNLYSDKELPMSELLRDMLMAYKYGLKTLYYFNTNDGAGEIDVTEPEEDCDSCVL